MKKILFSLLLVVFYSFNLYSQEKKKVLQVTSDQICECLEKNKVTDLNKMDSCFEKGMIKNLESIYEAYNLESLDDLDYNKFGLDIGALLMKNCNYILEHMTPSEYKVEDDIVPEEDLDCSQLKAGDYYYFFPNEITKTNDTTFVTIKDKMYLERMQRGRTYSLLDIRWISDCKFDLIYKHSNDEMKSRISEPGDTYTYEVISSTPNSYIIKTTWKTQTFKFELIKTN